MHQPLRDFLLVQPLDEHPFTPIAVAQRTGQHRSQQQLGRFGHVVALGPDVDPSQLAVGDLVCFGELPFRTLDKFLLLQESDIAGVVQS